MIPDRIIEKIDFTGTGDCWVWLAANVPHGYGVCWDGKKQTYAHRYMYELRHGKIPDGLCIDHLCRNRGCVNPDHLEAVTTRENLLRGETKTAYHANKSHCDNGHEFTPENTYVWGKDPRGRHCKTCNRLDAIKRYRRKKNADKLRSESHLQRVAS